MVQLVTVVPNQVVEWEGYLSGVEELRQRQPP